MAAGDAMTRYAGAVKSRLGFLRDRGSALNKGINVTAILLAFYVAYTGVGILEDHGDTNRAVVRLALATLVLAVVSWRVPGDDAATAQSSSAVETSGAHPLAARIAASWQPLFWWVLLIAALGLGISFRLYELGSRPLGIWYDEAQNSVVARSILDGKHPIFVGGQSQLPALFFYAFAGALKLFGYSVTSMRAVTTLAGIASVILVYLLARELFDHRVGVLAAFLLAVMRWHVNFSRFAMHGIFAPLFMLATFYFLVRGLKGKGLWNFALAGAMSAIGLQSYYSFVLVGVVLALFLLHHVIFNRVLPWTKLGSGIRIFAVAAIIVYAPLGDWAIHHWDQFNQRTDTVSITKDRSPREVFHVVVASTKKHLLMFNSLGDGNGRHNIPGAPMLDTVTGFLFALGAGYAFCRIRSSSYFLLLVWAAITLQAGIWSISSEAPQAYRTVSITPAIAMLAALPLAELWRAASAPTSAGAAAGMPSRGWRRFASVPAAALALTVIITVALLARVGESNFHQYFDIQLHDQRVYDSFTPEFAQTAQVVADEEDTKRVYLSRQFLGHPSFGLLTDPKKYRSYTAARDVIFPASDRDVLLVMDSRQFGMVPTLQRLYPNLTRDDHIDPFGRTFFSELVIPASDTAAIHELKTTVHSGDANGPILSSSNRPVDHEWSQSELPANGGPVTTVWEGYFWVSPALPTFALRFDGPGAVGIEVDDKVVASATASTTLASAPMTLGEHRVRLTATIDQPGRTSLSVEPRPEFAEPSDVLYSRSVGDRGFQVIYHAGHDQTGEPVMITAFPFAVAPDVLPTAQAIEYRGVLEAPVEGDYGFAVDGSNSSQVVVDDELVVDNAGLHGPHRAEGTTHLTSGPHVVSIPFNVTGAPDLSIEVRMPGSDWKLADGSEFHPVTAPYAQRAAVTLVPDAQWGTGRRIEGVDSPTAVTLLPDGTPVVSAGNAIVFLDAGGAVQRTLKLSGGVSVVDLAATDDGRLLIGDHAANTALLITADGTEIRRFGPFPSILGVTVRGSKGYVASPSGGGIYEFDLGGTGEPRLLPVSAPEAKVRAVQPSDVVVMADGTVFIADFERRTIVVSTDGVQGRTVPGPSGTGDMVSHLAVYGDLLLVSDPLNERILIYDKAGKQRGSYVFAPKNDGPRPTGIAVSAGGFVYAADRTGLVYGLQLQIPPELGGGASGR